MDRRRTTRRMMNVTALANGRTVRLLDMSRGGARFRPDSAPDLAVGDTVELDVTTRDALHPTILHCMGQVLRTEQHAGQTVCAMTLRSNHLDDPAAALAVLSRFQSNPN